MDKKILIQNLEETKSHIDKWIDSVNKVYSSIPEAQRISENLKFEIDALKNAPIEANHFLVDFDSGPYLNLNDVQSVFEPLPDVNKSKIGTLSLYSSSGSANLADFINLVGEMNTENSLIYYKEYSKKFQELQESQNRPNQILDMLNSTTNSENTIERFRLAVDAYMQWKSGGLDSAKAANSMRNFLYGLKGIVFQKVSGKTRKKINWDLFISLFILGEEGNHIHHVLLNEKTRYTKINEKLSNISKDRIVVDDIELDNIWFILLEHSYILLKIITES